MRFEKAFKLSAALHIGGLLLLGLADWIQNRIKKPPPPHVFTLMQPSSEVPEAPSIKAFNPTLTLPELPMLPTVAPPPALEKRLKVEKEVSKKAEKKQTLSYKAFIDQYGRPSPTTHQERNVTRIETEAIIEALKDFQTTSPAPTRTSEAALKAYIHALRKRIKAHWDKPLSGVGDELAAVIEFTVSEQGNVTGIRFIQSSGVSAFDASIREAFKRLSYVGRPPSGAPRTFQLRLRQIEASSLPSSSSSSS